MRVFAAGYLRVAGMAIAVAVMGWAGGNGVGAADEVGATRPASSQRNGAGTGSATVTAAIAETRPRAGTEAEMDELAGAWREFAGALMRDDAKGMAAAVYAADAEEAGAVQSEVAFRLANRAVAKEAVKGFGDEGKELLPDTMLLDEDIKQRLEWLKGRREASVQGDWAMMEWRAMGPSFWRTKDGWRVDFGMRWNEQYGKTFAEKKSALDKKTAGMTKVLEKIEKGDFADLQAARAGVVMALHAEEHAGEKAGTDAEGKRWRQRAAKAGNSAVEAFAFERIAELHASVLMQEGIPGGWDIELPMKGTPDAAGELYRMGLDAVPALVEALDDVTMTKTVAMEGSGEEIPARMNEIVAVILGRMCERRFTVGEGEDQVTLDQVGSQPELAGKFKEEILAWYKENRKRSHVERKIADVGDKYFRNRMDAVAWLGEHKVAAAGPAMEKYLVRMLQESKKRSNSLVDSEIDGCARAMGQVGDKNAAELIRRAALGKGE